MIHFLQPGWLLLLVPIIALSPRLGAGRFSRMMHLLIASLIVLSLAQPRLLLESKRGKLLVVCDRSDSMPTGHDSRFTEMINILDQTRPSSTGGSDAAAEMAVVGFGRRVAVEQADLRDEFTGFTSAVDPSGSRLGEAISTALSLCEPDASARVLVLSDGEVERDSLSDAISSAAAREVAIDFRHFARNRSGDVAIQRFTVPPTAAPGQSYLISAWLTSDVEKTVRFTLRRGNTVLAEGEKAVRPGLTRLTFRDSAVSNSSNDSDMTNTSAINEYQLTIDGDNDAVPENNSSRALLTVEGPRPILHLHEGPSRLGELMRQGGLPVESLSADSLDDQLLTLAGLGRYSSVILENVSAERVGLEGMETLRDWVTHVGGGLMFTGGRNSYAVGGYHKSPLDELMPVSMELRKEHRKANVAMVVVLDRSGSMTAPAGGGKTKMDLANLATAQVYDMLTPYDQFGCIAVDSSPHKIVGLSSPEGNGVRNKILKIESTGGGIYVYVGLEAAARELQKATAATRHIILFADAADSEEPGDYKKLLPALRKAGITCSVIGLGTKSDCDAKLLEEIAKLGGGRCFFTDRAKDLPRLFAQDTFVVAQNSFLDDPIAVHATAGITRLTEQPLGDIPDLGGYNLCYLRPRATMAVVAEDEYRSPILAVQQSGLGRVACYTGETDGKYTGKIGQWEHIGDFLTSIGRWTAGITQPLPPEMLAVAEMRGDVERVRLYLDPDRRGEPFEQMPIVYALQGQPGESPKKMTLPMQWVTPDVLETQVPLNAYDAVLATVDVPGVGRAPLGPACLPYSTEHLPRRVGEGLDNLRHLARSTGGTVRDDLEGIWKAMPPRPRYFAAAPWLALAAIIMALFETLQRRTGLLSSASDRLKRKPQPSEQKEKQVTRRKRQPKHVSKKRTTDTAAVQSKPVTPEPTTPVKPSDDSNPGIVSALQKASKQSKERTDR